jgi:hypothetical protein
MMLTQTIQTTSAQDYDVLNSSIKDTFNTIDRLELSAIESIRVMRDQQMYKIAGYKNFSQYCQGELHIYGGYRRINQLLGASIVISSAGELGLQIKNERQARPLLRLAKEPEKLIAALALALESNPEPSQSDFAAAANKVVPSLPRKKQSHKEPLVPENWSPMVRENQEPMVPEQSVVTVSSPSHPLYGSSGVILADPPNRSQQIVTFNSGERMLVNNDDLDGLIPAIASKSIERKYPPGYNEAIATLKEQHKIELERLEKDLRIGLLIEARTLAEEQVSEQLSLSEKLIYQYKEESIKLRQELDSVQSNRHFEVENQQLRERIHQLEHALSERPAQQSGQGNTVLAPKAEFEVKHPLSAKSVLKGNGERLKSEENTLTPDPKLFTPDFIDLRSLAIEPPKDNPEECLLLMGMALKNLSIAMNSTQALEAAAILLGSEPTPQAIAKRVEVLQLLPQAIKEIKQVLSQTGCTWQDFCTVAQQYEGIKQDYWASLTTRETDLIAALEKAVAPPVFQVGSIVAYADPYYTLYNARGEVVQEIDSEEVLVAWDHWKNEGRKIRYFRHELRFWQPQ